VIVEMLNEGGLNPEIHLIEASIRKRGYLPYQEGIQLEDGRDVSEHSSLIRSLTTPHEHVLIFVPEQVRDEVQQRVRDIIKPSQSSLSQFN